MMGVLLSRPVFLGSFALLSLVYGLLKLRLAMPHARAETAPPPEAPVPALHTLETSRDPEALSSALDEISRTLDRRAVEPLGKLLSHPDPRISAAAANVLGLIGDERALAYLFDSVGRLENELTALRDGAPETDPAAEPTPADVASAIADSEGPCIWPDRTLGRRLLESHAKPGDAALSQIQALAALAADREAPADYRYFALKNLELTLPASVVPVPDTLARELGLMLADESPAIRYATVGALEIIGGPAVTRYLESVIADPNPNVRARACIALAGLSPSRARKHLFSLLSDPDEAVRRAAQRALDELPA